MGFFILFLVCTVTHTRKKRNVINIRHQIVLISKQYMIFGYPFLQLTEIQRMNILMKGKDLTNFSITRRSSNFSLNIPRPSFHEFRINHKFIFTVLLFIILTI